MTFSTFRSKVGPESLLGALSSRDQKVSVVCVSTLTHTHYPHVCVCMYTCISEGPVCPTSEEVIDDEL